MPMKQRKGREKVLLNLTRANGEEQKERKKKRFRNKHTLVVIRPKKRSESSEDWVRHRRKSARICSKKKHSPISRGEELTRTV